MSMFDAKMTDGIIMKTKQITNSNLTNLIISARGPNETLDNTSSGFSR